MVSVVVTGVSEARSILEQVYGTPAEETTDFFGRSTMLTWATPETVIEFVGGQEIVDVDPDEDGSVGFTMDLVSGETDVTAGSGRVVGDTIIMWQNRVLMEGFEVGIAESFGLEP